MFSKFLGGATAGVLASLTTTLIVEACKVLLINPDTYPFGERVRSTAKILATGASVVVGVLVREALADLPLGTLPLAEDVVPVFCRIAGSPILKRSITNERLAVAGYFSILNYYESLRLCD